jgi:hypothetical protein
VSGAAAHAAVVAQATKASGAIVRVEPADFLRLVKRHAEPLVVVTYGGLFAKRYEYLMGYRGLVFHTKSVDALVLPRDCEVVRADRIWIPS